MLDGQGGILQSLDNATLGKFHRKVMLTSGVGFFTDAYDLFIIGVVIDILPLAKWQPFTDFQISLLSSVALLSAIIGSVVFGRLIDKYGRKRIYGTELVLLITGALGSAFLVPVNGIYILAAWRFILGIGIGGDYADSSTIMTEYANVKDRGRMVGTVFSMQSFGLIAGPLVALGFIFSGIPLSIAWKIMLAIGALPALMAVYFRRQMPETPRFQLGVNGNYQDAKKQLEKYTGMNLTGSHAEESRKINAKWSVLFTDRRFLLTLIGTAGTWFLMDWVLYGNSIMSSLMLKSIISPALPPIDHIIKTTEYSALIFGIAAFPGYWIATYTTDRIGRKPIQVAGFSAMAISFAVLGIFTQLTTVRYVYEFLIVYGLSYFFIEFGPNVTTFIYPPEVFPVTSRGLGTGLSAGGGKTGAFIGTFVNVFIIAILGENKLFLILAFFSLIGAILTIILLPEPTRKRLEESSGENRYITHENLRK
ncbi:MAG: MFS transporter [Thermoplasmata archaeon]